jgi:hypothetical protein
LWFAALHSLLLTPADEIAREVYGEAGGADPAAAAVKGGMVLGLVGYGSGSDSDSEEEPQQQHRVAAAAGPLQGPASKAGPAAVAHAAVKADNSHVRTPPPDLAQKQQQQQQQHNQVAPADATAMDTDAPAAASKVDAPDCDTAAAPEAADGAAPAIHSADELAASADLGTSFSRGQRWVLGGGKFCTAGFRCAGMCSWHAGSP